MKRTILLPAVAAVTTMALAGPASAAVTFDGPSGTGFVGKGDVQLAFGWNNKQLQDNAKSVTFSASAPASQAVTQTATQSAFQTSTEHYEQYVSCDTPNGNSGKTKFRDGERDGKATAKRTATRSGSRSGTLVGSLSSSVNVDTRKNAQQDVTGFTLTGFAGGGPVFTATGEPEFGAVDFPAWEFGDFQYSDIKWISNDSTNPCFLPTATNVVVDEPVLVETITSSVHEQDIEYGVITYDDVVAGAWTVTFSR